MIPRWMHRVYAYFAGYFWAPCPICDRPFGGHEVGGVLWIEWDKGRITCPHCPGDHWAPGVTPWIEAA